jgi:broad specificity phosphatase PhoE
LKLIFVRHPETEALVYRIMYGHTHSPYTEKGTKSVPWVADQLASEPVRAVYSSPLERTKTLADAIACTHGLPVVTDERIKEMGVGIFEQMSVADAEKAHPEHLRPFLDDFGNYKAPGSELFSEVKERVGDFLKELIRKEEAKAKEEVHEGPIVIVSHSMAIRGALAYLFDADLSDLWHIRIHPAAILNVRYRDRFAILEGLRDPHNIIL